MLDLDNMWLLRLVLAMEAMEAMDQIRHNSNRSNTNHRHFRTYLMMPSCNRNRNRHGLNSAFRPHLNHFATTNL
jgi:hypothetical protein